MLDLAALNTGVVEQNNAGCSVAATAANEIGLDLQPKQHQSGTWAKHDHTLYSIDIDDLPHGGHVYLDLEIDQHFVLALKVAVLTALFGQCWHDVDANDLCLARKVG